ncbi:hypothetical protein EVA_20611, partial [gut metagenome]
MLEQHSNHLKDEIKGQFQLIQGGGPVSEEHLIRLCRKLRRVYDLRAFDDTIEELLEEDSKSTWMYIEKIRPVFTRLAADNHYRDSVQLAYFAY